MKKIYITLLVLLCFSFCKAQYVAIPDSNFVIWLQVNGFGGCINGQTLDTTCAAVLSAKTIRCDSFYLTNLTGVQYFKSLDTLICSYNGITLINNLPDSLQYFDCSNNPLDSLPVFPATLNYVNCTNNQLAALPALQSVAVLNCSHNQLVTLPALPATLHYLDCSYNNIITLPALPAALSALYCYTNQLATLPALPSSLVTLNCSDNGLNSLPSSLPVSLTGLYCGLNQLTALPALPASLRYLYCGLNTISPLPTLPAALDTLDCDNNMLTSLPALPASLVYFDCSNNSIGTLPPLPAALRSLYCGSNGLSTLPALPDSMYVLDIDNNQNISCLAPIKKITIFYFFDTNVLCVPNQGQVDSSAPNIDSIPVCSNTYDPNNCLGNGVAQLEVGGWKLEVFPNPANDVVNVVLDSEAALTDNNSIIIVTDIMGRTVLQQVLSSNKTSIDLSGTAAGIYFIHMNTANQTQTVKVVKE